MEEEIKIKKFIIEKLGYKVDEMSLHSVDDLLKENKIKNIVNFISALEIYNAKNNTCAKLSLAGMFPSLKIKDAEYEDIEKLMNKYDIFI